MWILRTACLQLVEWARDPQTAHWTLAVNVSARQFRHSHFVDEVLGVLEETGPNPHRLKLELTETLLLADVEDTILRMDTLREAGLNPFLFEMANIRDQASWVHNAEPTKATDKAKDLIRMSVARASCTERQVSSTSELVIPWCMKRASGPTCSATQSRKAITSA